MHKAPILIALLPLSGCWAKKTMCRGLHKEMPAECRAFDESQGTGTDASAVLPTGGQQAGAGIAPGGYALTRVAPEVLSNNLELTANIGMEYKNTANATGQTIDYLVAAYGVPLGGIDFQSVSTRDPTSKAQTLLVNRVFASEFGAGAVVKEIQADPAKRVIFTLCDPKTDRPLMDSDAQLPAAAQAAIQAGEARWTAQVTELFWRFYARPPTDAEMAAVKAAFITSVQTEGFAPAGWVTVVYAMLASQEFWHI